MQLMSGKPDWWTVDVSGFSEDDKINYQDPFNTLPPYSLCAFGKDVHLLSETPGNIDMDAAEGRALFQTAKEEIQKADYLTDEEKKLLMNQESEIPADKKESSEIFNTKGEGILRFLSLKGEMKVNSDKFTTNAKGVLKFLSVRSKVKSASSFNSEECEKEIAALALDFLTEEEKENLRNDLKGHTNIKEDLFKVRFFLPKTYLFLIAIICIHVA
jgi:hypothetical protein